MENPNYDADLVAQVFRTATKDNVHDIRNLVLIYEGMAELAKSNDPFAKSRLPLIEARLRLMIHSHQPKNNRPGH